MKKALITIIFSLFFFVFAPSVLAEEWTDIIDDTRLTFDNATSFISAMEMDSAGNIHIVWQDNRDGNLEVYYTKLDGSDGSTLVEDTRLTFAGASSYSPSIGLDSTGNVHIVWYDYRSGSSEIYYTKLDGGDGITLIEDTRLSPIGIGSYSPKIGLDSANNVNIVWQDNRDGNWEIYYTKIDGSNGSTLIDGIRLIYDSANSMVSDLEIDSAGNIHIVWQDNRDGNWEIYYTKLDGNDGGTLTEDTRLTFNGSISWYSRLDIDSANNAHIAWYDYRDSNPEIYYTKLNGSDGSTLVEDIRLTYDSANSILSDLEIDSAGNIHIVWQDNRDGNWEIYYTKIDGSNGNTLVNDDRLTFNGADSQFPKLGVDSTDNVHIVWADSRDGNWEIYYTKGAVRSAVNAPLITYSQEENYWTDGVDPNQGFTSANFEFKAVYTDQDNNAPEYMRVVIDGVSYEMNLDQDAVSDLNDGGYINGEQYVYTNVFSTGIYNYYFEAGNGEATTRTPETGELSFEVESSKPVITYSQEENYRTDGVNPNKGTAESTELVFKAVYTDDDNDAPENINIIIGNGSTAITSPLILDATATSTLRDNDFTNGEQYIVTFTFPKGKYNYHFEASDGENTVRFPETGALGFETGYSNVAFLPGIQASRLYKPGENQLWEPNRNADVKMLYLDENGESSDVTIYTRDIIDESNILPTPQFNIYKKFIDFMDNDMVGGNIINKWKALPYDWRFDFKDVLESGISVGDNIYYNTGTTSAPYIIQEIRKLAAESANGKVTIISHSMGGLIAKQLLQKLKDDNDELYYDIDRLIMAASPQLGTPKAIEGLLHANKQQIGVWELGIFLDEEVARELSENMISAYNLLPSEEYFKKVASPVIEFKSSVSRIPELNHLAGTNITTADALYEFLLGSNGKRTEPKPNNEEYPNVLKSKLLARATTTHNTILDPWRPPSHIEVIQIAGWGKDTIRGLEYECGLLTCASLSSLDRELLWTSDGDGTVISPSATAMDEAAYYVNIRDYNSWLEFQRNRDHADIMEIKSLQELIKSAVTQNIDNQNLPDYIQITKPRETDSSLRLILKSPVNIDIYDSYGNHTGLIDNPDPESDLQFFEAKIPNSYYLDVSGHKYLGLDGRDEYQIDLTGLDLGTFTFEIQEVLNDEEVNRESFINIPVASGTKGMLTISETEVSELALDIDGDGAIDITLTGDMGEDNVSSLKILKNIINDLNIHTSLKKKLISKLKQVEKDLERGNINRAVKRLNNIIRHLEREIAKNIRDEEKDKHHRHGHHRGKEKISTEDAEKLIEIIKKIQYNLI